MSSAGLPAACGLMLLSVGLALASEGVTSRLRGVILDALHPGQQAVRATVDTLRDGLAFLSGPLAHSHSHVVARLESELWQARSHSAALAVRLARATEKRTRDDSLPSTMRQLPRLTTPSLIEAGVLGGLLAEEWRSGRLLDQGAANGVRESALVLSSRQPLVDIGQDGDVSPEDALLLGRCVIGKIERVGRWTSTFLLLTDADYRGPAQVMHESETGFTWGAKCLLKGRGDPLCVLDGIAPSESVRVGDAVYSTSRTGAVATPLYYGRVVEATLGPEDRAWRVLVEPAPLPRDLTSVQVLRMNLNIKRLAAGL